MPTATTTGTTAVRTRVRRFRSTGARSGFPRPVAARRRRDRPALPAACPGLGPGLRGGRRPGADGRSVSDAPPVSDGLSAVDGEGCRAGCRGGRGRGRTLRRGGPARAGRRPGGGRAVGGGRLRRVGRRGVRGRCGAARGPDAVGRARRLGRRELAGRAGGVVVGLAGCVGGVGRAECVEGLGRGDGPCERGAFGEPFGERARPPGRPGRAALLRRRDQFGGRGAAFGVLVEARRHDLGQVGVAGPQRCEVGCVVDDPVQEVETGAVAERRPPARREGHEGPQGEHVRGAGQAPGRGLLG